MIIFSAIQPTGKIHLGNYLGALRPWISLTTSQPILHSTSSFSLSPNDALFSLADLHGLTTMSQIPTKEDTTFAAAQLIASGLDPRTLPFIIFRQSQVCYTDLYLRH